MTVTAAGSLPIELQTIDEEKERNMPSLSSAQQNLAALALHDPDKVSDKNKSILSMKTPDLKEFSSTPTKGLPKHVGKAGKRMMSKR